MALATPLEHSTAFDDHSSGDRGGDDDWIATESVLLHRTVSLGSKHYGFTSLGRGFDWAAKENEERNRLKQVQLRSRSRQRRPLREHNDENSEAPSSTPAADNILGQPLTLEPESGPDSLEVPTIHAPLPSLSCSAPAAILVTSTPPDPDTPTNSHSTPSIQLPAALNSSSPSSPNTPLSPPTAPRPPTRRHSSHKRVSLVAGRIKVIEDPPPLPPSDLISQLLPRRSSQSSFLSMAASTRAPSPVQDESHFLGNHSINDYVIDGEAGRGAYGLVKRARRRLVSGALGPPLIVKQVIKSRILADCWKKHPKLGTIPIEIYVMSAISNTSYVLPPRRPWDPMRPGIPHTGEVIPDWEEGAVVKGHPNICPLLDFFEDAHFYYLVLPSTSPPPGPDGQPLPSDLFDLVELYPDGLPAYLIRSYLGQIADALCFLHSKGIVHRDIKDENVVLGPTDGKCILIDFGSSGLVRRGGWDTFSGTLDYAGPEILRGESYNGKEQDVWAFGVVAYVLLVGECPFLTPTEAQEGLVSPFGKARIALDERCHEGHEDEGLESDGGGRLGDAYRLVMECLQVDVASRPTFEHILCCRFLAGTDGW